MLVKKENIFSGSFCLDKGKKKSNRYGYTIGTTGSEMIINIMRKEILYICSLTCHISHCISQYER